MKRISIGMLVLLVQITLIVPGLFPQTFTEQTGIILPGLSNGSVAWGDYDNDGDLDILVAGFDASNLMIVKVFGNNGSNSFTDQSSIFSPAIPTIFSTYRSIASALWVDFDNDGYLDILINGPSVTRGNVLMVYRNEGNNTFTLKSTIPYLTWAGNSVDCGDYDNDGDKDILITTNVSTKVYQNQGNFVFTEQYTVSLPGFYDSSSRWGDYDNDGDLDIILSGTRGDGSYSTSIYRNQGNNVFTLQAGIFLTGVSGGSSEWGDYNNDGFPDILLTGNGISSIYKNNGNNTFFYQPGIVLKGVSNGTGKWGDIDNDGDLDLIISGNNNGSNITTIYLNNGNNTFTEATSIVLDGVNQCSVDLCDYDNDGDLDLLLSGFNGTTSICKVYRNNASVTNPIPAAPTGLTSVSSGNDIILKWKPVTSDNTPAKSLSYNIMVGTAPGGIDIVSPNSAPAGFHRISGMGNGQLDTTFVLRNIKKGTTYYWKVQAVDNSFKGGAFSAQSTFTYSPSYQAYGLKASVIGGKEATLTWSRGNGANCIIFMKEANTGSALPSNGTTYTANAIFKSGTQIGVTGWYCLYKGTLTSINVTGLKANTDYIYQVIEFDGTPGSEVYNTQTAADDPVTFKTGSFTELKNANLLPVTIPQLSSVETSSCFWIDIDNDNDLDLLLVGPTATRLYRNDGSDIFTLLPVSLASGFSASAACGDYNNDGFIDILINDGTNIRIYKNNGNNTFTEQTSISLPGTTYGSLALGDYDNDGDLDLVLTGETTSDGAISKIFKNNGNNTFTEQNLITLTGVQGSTAKWGDYDNDGFLDLLISGGTNEATEITKIYRNDRNNNFIEQTQIILSGFGSGSADWGDYDNDGDLDIILSGYSNGNHITKIYLNNGNNTFTEQTAISLPSVFESSVVWGDYDNDGDLDILLSGYTGTFSPLTKIYRNNGNNTFTEDLACSIVGVGYCAVAWGDYDNDGDLDILLTGNTSNDAVSKIYRNDVSVANIKPAAPTGIVSTVNKSDVTLKWNSVRSDNTPYKAISYNIKVGTVSGGINVVSPHASASGYRRLAGIGNCNLDTTFLLKSLPFGTYYWSVQAIDNGFAGGTFSAEGNFTIVPVQAKGLFAKILNNNSLLLKWERGNGDRCMVFSKQTSSGIAVPVNNTGYIADSEYGFGGQIGSTGWYCVYDGRADSLIVTGLAYKTQYSFHVIEYMGTFGTEQYFTQVVNGNPGVFSTSLFTEQTGISIRSSWFNPVAWGDYDNDGFLDLLVPGFPTRIYRNNGDNTFTEKSAISLVDINFGSAAWGDYDNDGDLDIIITGATVNSNPASGPVTKIYRNDGNDIFTEQTQISLTAVDYSSVAWGDFDNDGYLDILLTGATGSDPNFNPVTKIYRNNGNNSFTEQTQISLTGVLQGSAKWGDYDNDGDLDIVLTGTQVYQPYSGSGITKIYKNNGNKTFSEQTQINLQGFGHSSSSWGDFDNDGDLDLIITAPGVMIMYQNMGNDIFTPHLSFPSLPWQSACYASWGDYDNDGFLDIILTNPGLDTKIYRNTRGITVPGAVSQWFNQQDDDALKNIGYSFVDWADYDNDGDLDIIMAKNVLPTTIYTNNLIMKSGLFKPNIPPAAPLGLLANNTPSGVTLKWNPVKNDETPYNTMTYNVRIGTKKDSTNICPSHSALTGFRRIATMGNAQMDTTFLLKNLSSRKYYWSVQAVDQGLKGGPWAAVDSFVVKNVQAFFKFDTVCLGLPTHFTDQSVATDGIQSWKWDFKDGTISTLQNPAHIFTTSGTYFVKLIIRSNGGVKDSLEKNIIVKPRPATGFTALTTCQGIPVTITNTTNNNGLTITSWNWNFGDTQTSGIQQPAPHGYLNSGDYIVKLKATAINGCTDSITKTVTVANYPVAAVTTNAPLTFCNGDSVILSVGYNNNFSYKWLIGGIAVTGADSSSYAAKLSGNFTVEVTNNKGNCKTTSSQVTVNVQNTPFKPVIESDNYQTGKCMSDNLVVLNIAQPVSGYNYQWFRNGVPVSNETMTGFQGVATAGDYSVEANLSGCKIQSELFNISYLEAPPKPGIYSQGPTVWYLASSNDSASQYKWYFNGNIIQGADKYIYVANHNLGQYFVSIANSKGCFTQSDVITIPSVVTGIDDVYPFDGLKIFPNPAPGLFTLEMDNQIFGELIIKILTPDGKNILKIKFEKTTVHFSSQIDLSGQSKGLYLINIMLDKYFSNNKIIIE